MELTKNSASNDGLTLQFTVTGATPAFLNSVRRAIMDTVPTMAIEDVEFRKNNSVMFDETLAHRLGLIPLKTDVTAYTFRNDEGSAANQCTLTLEADGPCTVTAGMIKSSDSAIVPVYPDMIIVELLEGQSISLEAKAVLGRGREHAKWASGLSYYSYASNVTVKDDVPESAKKSLPQGAFDANGKVSAKAIMANNLVDAVDGITPEIKVTYDESKLTMTVESWGQHSGVDVVSLAVQSINDSLDELAQATEAIK